jgi:hypothetical protein
MGIFYSTKNSLTILRRLIFSGIVRIRVGPGINFCIDFHPLSDPPCMKWIETRNDDFMIEEIYDYRILFGMIGIKNEDEGLKVFNQGLRGKFGCFGLFVAKAEAQGGRS